MLTFARRTTVQLAVAAGYEVITTASAHNFDYVKKLGASQVFDYNSPTVHEDLLKAFESKTLAGVMDCIGAPAWAICVDVALVCPLRSSIRAEPTNA